MSVKFRGGILKYTKVRWPRSLTRRILV